MSSCQANYNNKTYLNLKNKKILMNNKTLYVLPRLLIIIYIGLISIFALDSQSVIDFMVHLIPSALLVGIAFVAWRWPRPGGIIFILLGLLFTFYFNTLTDITAFFVISFPILVIGAIFTVEHYNNKNILPNKKRKKRR